MLPFLILKHFDWLIHDDMEFVLFLEGPFSIEISSNESIGTTILVLYQIENMFCDNVLDEAFIRSIASMLWILPELLCSRNSKNQIPVSRSHLSCSVS